MEALWGQGGYPAKIPFHLPIYIFMIRDFFFLSLLLKTRTQIRRDHLQKVQDLLLFSSLGVEYQPNKITVELESEQHQCILFLKPIILFLKLLSL